jgi:hypothetical protein
MSVHRPIVKTAAEVGLAKQFAALAKPDADRIAAFAAFAAEGHSPIPCDSSVPARLSH